MDRYWYFEPPVHPGVADADLGNIEILVGNPNPGRLWKNQFRSMTIRAWKPRDENEGLDAGQSAIYRGPWKEVVDDSGNVLRRGEWMAITTGQMQAYQGAPLKQDLILRESDGKTTPATDPSDLPIANYCSMVATVLRGEKNTHVIVLLLLLQEGEKTSSPNLMASSPKYWRNRGVSNTDRRST